MALIDEVMALHTLCTREEYGFLRECAESAPDGLFVELGTFQGASTIVIADVANERGLPCLTIDNFSMQRTPTNPQVVRNNLSRAGIDPLPRIVSSQSHIVPNDVGKVAFLFIDTDHRAEVLNPELDAWLPLVSPGGIVALHDYNCPERYPTMTPAIDGRLGDSDEWERIGLVGHLVAFQRRV